jgi:hypothetical protein
VDEHHFVIDDWSEQQPSIAEENEFIEQHGYREYSKWHLGIDEEQPEDDNNRYEFPYGDFVDVRYAVIAAESTASQAARER